MGPLPFCGLLLSAILLSPAMADTAPAEADATSGHHAHHHGMKFPFGSATEGAGGMPMAGFWQELELTPEQQQTIRAVLEDFRPRWWQLRQQAMVVREQMTSVEPDDPEYATATAQAAAGAATLASAMVNLLSEMRTATYAVLTAAQRAQLREMMAQREARWEEWRQRQTQPAP